MKLFKRLTAAALAVSMTLSAAAFQGITAFAAETPTTCGGWYETAYATWPDSSATSAEIYYKGENDTDYTQLNSSSDAVDTSLTVYNGSSTYSAAGYKQCVVKQTDTSTGRVDIMGIGYGDFDIQIVTSGGTTYEASVTILQEDRSGYAHFGADSDYIGAYTDEGVLKDDTTVIYVTEDNKNTVSWKPSSSKNTTYEGIGKIASNIYRDTDYPIAVRFLGEVDTTAWVASSYSNSTYYISESTGRTAGTYTDWNGKSNSYADTTNTGVAISNLNTKMTYYSGNTLDITYIDEETVGAVSTSSTSSYKDEDTSLNMMDFKGGSSTTQVYIPQLTIEGIGTDTIAKNWGITITRGTGVEVRNINFVSSPEDACSADSSERVWIHRCTFEVGANHCDLTYEQDKHEGDGSTDFTEDSNVTCSYNVYNNCHKTSLNGGSDSTKQWNYTYHHNYYNSCSSRLPMTRYVNVHSYNNYTYGASTAISARASAFVFSEANYYDSVNTVFGSQYSTTYGCGFIKSYNDTFNSTTPSWSSYIVQASSRTDTINVSSIDSYNQHNSGGSDTYINNFDVDKDYFYYSDGASNVSYLTTAAKAKTYVTAQSGVMKDSVTYDDIMNSLSDDETDGIITSKQTVTVDDYTTNSYFTVDSPGSTQASGVFRITQNSKVSFTTGIDGAAVTVVGMHASSSAGTAKRTLYIYDSSDTSSTDCGSIVYEQGVNPYEDGEVIASDLSAGSYYLQPDGDLNITSITVSFPGAITDTAELTFSEVETISEATTLCNYFSITPTMEVVSSSKTVDGKSYEYLLKSGGDSGTISAGNAPTKRAITFTTAGAGVIQFCAVPAGSDKLDSRTILIYNTNDYSKTVDTISFESTTAVMTKICNLPSAGTYCIAFGGGVNIYGITVAVGRSVTTDNNGDGYIFTDGSDSYAVAGLTAADAESGNYAKLTVTAVGSGGQALAETGTVYEYAAVDGFVIKPAFLDSTYGYLYVVQIKESGGATDFTYSSSLTEIASTTADEA